MKKSFLIVSVVVLLLMSSCTLFACDNQKDPMEYKEGLHEFVATGDEDFDWLGYKIERISMDFKMISNKEYRAAKNVNVVRNSKNWKKYSVKLFIKLFEEEQGHYYDFIFDGSTFCQHTMTVLFKNEELGIDSEELVVFGLSWNNRSWNYNYYVFMGWSCGPAKVNSALIELHIN